MSSDEAETTIPCKLQWHDLYCALVEKLSSNGIHAQLHDVRVHHFAVDLCKHSVHENVAIKRCTAVNCSM